MILPMMGFLFALILVGGFALLIATVNRISPPLRPQPLLPYVGFVCLFAGLGALLLSMGLGLIAEKVFRSHGLAGIGFFGGYVLGGCGGAALGFIKASFRRSDFCAESSPAQQSSDLT